MALYKFDSGKGNTIKDRSAISPPLDLTIENPSAVTWNRGGLVVRSATKISSTKPARKITDAVKRSGGLTIEAWIKPANDRQNGPARIVSISADSGQRNLTLGQDGKRYDVRLRTTTTSTNGIPSTTSAHEVVNTALTHVVYTRDGAGDVRIYINGRQDASRNVAGNLTTWNDGFPLVLANELTGDRPWLGEFRLVAIYGRALDTREVRQDYDAGAEAQADPMANQNRNKTLFETRIAPLLAQNCLECHDQASKKGKLDLSNKVAAIDESEGVIVPGKSSESLLWDRVASNEMPPKGPSLSEEDKRALREWIDAGATWSLNTIDPAVYTHHTDPGKPWVRRLTVPEYITTVRSAVGVDIADEARKILPPDLRADGFRNTAYNLNVDLEHVEAYARLAEIIVQKMDVLKFTSRFSKSQSLSTDDTMRQTVSAMGKWLLRGPLDEREVTNYSGIATTVASAGGDYKEAVSYIIEAMLQSPRFIYRMESQQGDGTAWPVSQYELASRLSYMIWGGPPDNELMRAADAGELHTEEQVRLQVRRMLKDPRAIERSLQFLSEWIDLQRLDNLRPDRKTFPKWDPTLAEDMRQETVAYFRHIVWEQHRPLADLFNAQLTFATPRLAKHYGLKPNGSGLSRYDLSSIPARGGLLTQGSVLTVGGDNASMVTRGLFVFHDLLRGVVKDPPPGVDTTPVPSKPGLPQRRVSEQRIANESCKGCHVRFEPLAFGLERFDGLGVFREKDRYGNDLREDGDILFPGSAKPVAYQSSAELMDLLARSDRVRQTITWKLTQFALGRPLGAADANEVEAIHQSAQKEGGTYANVITAIATSDLILKKSTEQP